MYDCNQGTRHVVVYVVLPPGQTLQPRRFFGTSWKACLVGLESVPSPSFPGFVSSRHNMETVAPAKRLRDG